MNNPNEVNKAALSSLAMQQQGVVMAIVGMKQALMSTYPTSPLRLARIDAANKLLDTVVALHGMFKLVMDQTVTGTEVDEFAAELDKVVIEAERAVKLYVEFKRGEGHDVAFVEPKQMARFVTERAEAQALNDSVDRAAEIYKQAQETAEAEDADVVVFGASEARSFMSFPKNNLRLPLLTDHEVLVS